MNSLQLLVVVGAICAATGDEKIVGGDDTTADRYPFFVVLRYEGYNAGANGLFCAGTIIDDEHILSAAHCFYGYPDTTLYTAIARKKDLLDDAGQSRGISGINIHPDYNNDTFEYDIAIIKVDSPFKFNDKVQPAALAMDDRTVKKNNCYFPGWGWIDEETGEYPEVLQEIKTKTTSKTKCKDAADKNDNPDVVYGSGDAIKGYMSCSKNKKAGSCDYDSGGALGCFDKRTGNYTMVGLRSWTLADLPCDRGWTVYVRVSKFVEYISELAPGATFV